MILFGHFFEVFDVLYHVVMELIHLFCMENDVVHYGDCKVVIW